MYHTSSGINVLPPKERRKIRITYFFHLVTVASIMFALVFGAGALFLLPSYFLAREQANTSERFRDAIAGTIDLKEANDTERNISILDERVRLGGAFEENRVFAALMNDLGRVPLKGISLTAISFTRPNETVSVQLAGNAKTRGALLAFVEELRINGAFSTVALPVSQLISEEDIVFSVEAVYVKK